MQPLNPEEIDSKVRSQVGVQGYSKKTLIDGVKIIEIKHFVGEDGSFEELMRLDEQGNLQEVPEFKLRQVNRSELLPGSVKAWHLHFNQEDVWFIPPTDFMLLGLWDVRESSATKDVKMRIPMGGGATKLVYIPRGVAHGVANIGKKMGTIFYFVNQQFNPENPDERRLPWNALGEEFWRPEKG